MNLEPMAVIPPGMEVVKESEVFALEVKQNLKYSEFHSDPRLHLKNTTIKCWFRKRDAERLDKVAAEQLEGKRRES